MSFKKIICKRAVCQEAAAAVVVVVVLKWLPLASLSAYFPSCIIYDADGLSLSTLSISLVSFTIGLLFLHFFFFSNIKPS